MKKGMKLASIFLLSLIFLSLIAGIVSAATAAETTKNIITGIGEIVKVPLDMLTQNETGFVRTLFFILVFLIISTLISLIPLFSGRRGTSFLVALIISILAVYFIPQEFIKVMLNPYSALGGALISVVPFILMFLFTRYMLTNTFSKKLAWMFFALFLIGLTVYTAYTNPTGENSWFSWLYGIVSILALVMVFANKWIDQHIWSGEMEEKYTRAERRLQSRLALDRLKLEEARATGI